MDRFFNLRTQFVQEREKMRLLCLLRGVVTLPVLRVLLFDRDCLSNSLCLAIGDDLTLQNDFNCEYMLASRSPVLKVRTTAKR